MMNLIESKTTSLPPPIIPTVVGKPEWGSDVVLLSIKFIIPEHENQLKTPKRFM